MAEYMRVPFPLLKLKSDHFTHVSRTLEPKMTEMSYKTLEFLEFFGDQACSASFESF